MKFYYNKLILWMKNGQVRELEFLPNKVNIITGGSETGKSAILSIIDYCFFADKDIKITEEFINENVKWYGINFCINEQTYTIARGSLNGAIPSSDYYFSSIGKIPKEPYSSISEINLKNIMNKEFSINENTVVPFGGKKIKAGSKISIRYFMLFNSQDDNTINNSDTYFNKQTDAKYQEALERTFDLALGISDEENVLISEKINSISKELNRYQRKQNAIDSKINAFEKEKRELIKRAKELNLISNDIIDNEDSLKKLFELCEQKVFKVDVESDAILDKLYQDEKRIRRDIKSIKNFLLQVNEYKYNKEQNMDSLKPIQYLVDNYGELINHPAVEDIISSLEINYKEMLKKVSNIKKNDFGMKEELRILEGKLNEVSEKINRCANKIDDNNIFDKYIFLGEAKAKLELYNSGTDEKDFADEINKLEYDLKLLENKLAGSEGKRTSIIKLIEMSAESLMKRCKLAMETYAEYVPIFNYREKKLELMNPKIAQVSKVVGSSSNYLFLHLFLFLALHEVIIAQKVKYIPSYIILDQPSRPYYDNNNDEFKDKEKITSAISLLDYYISYIKKEYNKDFQMIVFEHIPKEIWMSMENVHLVEEFKNGNKLIRKSDISK